MVPRLGPRRKRRGDLLVDGGVEPLLPLALCRLEGLQVEVAGVLADLDLQPADGKGVAAPVVGPHLEDVFPKCSARVDTKEALTKGHKDRNVKYAIRGEIMDLPP